MIDVMLAVIWHNACMNPVGFNYRIGTTIVDLALYTFENMYSSPVFSQ